MFNRQRILKDMEPTEQTGLEEYEPKSFVEKYRLDKTWGKLLGARGQNCPMVITKVGTGCTSEATRRGRQGPCCDICLPAGAGASGLW